MSTHLQDDFNHNDADEEIIFMDALEDVECGRSSGVNFIENLMETKGIHK